MREGQPAGQDLAERVAARYRELLERKQTQEGRTISDVEVARETGLSRNEIQRIRRGLVRDPRAATLQTLAAYFALDPPSDFFNGKAAGQLDRDVQLQVLLRDQFGLSEQSQELITAFVKHALQLEQGQHPPSHDPSPPDTS